MKASWLLLGLGIALEVAGTVCMKLADGFRDLRAATLMYVFYALSLTTLTLAFKRIDIGVGYAVWSGAGLALIATIGMVWFREPATTARLVFLTFILVGLLGLRLAAAPPVCSQFSPSTTRQVENQVPERRSRTAGAQASRPQKADFHEQEHALGRHRLRTRPTGPGRRRTPGGCVASQPFQLLARAAELRSRRRPQHSAR